MRTGWNLQHWRSPIIREQVQPDRVIWALPMISLIPEESLERLKNRFISKFSKFTSLEAQALVTADIEGYVDNARMRQITDCHTADITKILQGLVSQRALSQNGQGRWTKYYLPSVAHTIHKDGHTIHKDEISSVQWSELQEIAQPARQNHRLSSKEMESIILMLCKDRWLTRRQISELVNRHSDGLRSRFLTPMVDHNLLQLRFPDKPRRTDQSYKAKDSFQQ